MNVQAFSDECVRFVENQLNVELDPVKVRDRIDCRLVGLSSIQAELFADVTYNHLWAYPASMQEKRRSGLLDGLFGWKNGTAQGEDDELAEG